MADKVVDPLAGSEGPGLSRAGAPSPAETAGARRHVLVVANRLPYPLDDGWKVRTFHVIRAIAAHARVTVVVFHPSSGTETIAAAADAFGPGVRLLTIDPPRAYTPGALLRGLVSSYPVHVWNQESKPMRRVVANVLTTDPVNLVVAESTFLARYLDLIPGDVPHIIDTHNIDSVTFSRYASALQSGPRRLYASITARKLGLFEAATFRRADGVWVCSDVESELVRRTVPGAAVWTIPNGVDTTFFAPAETERVADRVLFFGRLDYYPNVDGLSHFVREILPRLKRSRPGVELHVVGAEATRDVVKLCESEPAMKLIGRVADLRTALRSASVVIVPLRVGGGTRLKVLEALSMGLPVVSTTIGAEGIELTNGKHLMVVDDPAKFADAVATLLDDPGLAQRLGANGRTLVKDEYDWARVSRLVGLSMAEVAEPGRK